MSASHAENPVVKSHLVHFMTIILCVCFIRVIISHTVVHKLSLDAFAQLAQPSVFGHTCLPVDGIL